MRRTDRVVIASVKQTKGLEFDAVVFIEVDAVVDDVDLVRIEVEEAEEIHLGLLADGDDGIGHLQRGGLEPDGEVIAAAELLALPRAEGLK